MRGVKIINIILGYNDLENKDAYPKNYELYLINDLPARFIFCHLYKTTFIYKCYILTLTN